MHRHSVAIALTAALLLAGCTQTAPEGDAVQADFYVFDHAGVDVPVVEGGIQYDTDQLQTQRYAVVVTGRSRFNDAALNQEAEQFIGDTDFSQSTLLVYQEFPASSSPDYQVTAVTRQDDRIVVSINNRAQAGTADITVETVLVRVNGRVDAVQFVTEDGETVDAHP